MAIITQKQSNPFWKKRQFRQGLTGWLFAAPILIYFIVWVFVPILASMGLVFFEWNGLQSLSSAKFVGLGNANELIGDGTYRIAFINTFKFAIVVVIASVLLGLILALIINNLTRFVTLVRSIYYLPVILPITAMSLLWTMMLQPRYGLLNQFLTFLHLPNVAWLVNPSVALYSLSLMTVWKSVGWYMIILLAGLKSIPKDYFEAGRIDGANGWQLFTRITLPLLRPTLLFVMVIAVINSLQVFTPVYLMTQGGPGDATNVVVYWVYVTAFKFLRFGYGTTQTAALFIAILGLTIVQLRIFREGGLESYT